MPQQHPRIMRGENVNDDDKNNDQNKNKSQQQQREREKIIRSLCHVKFQFCGAIGNFLEGLASYTLMNAIR